MRQSSKITDKQSIINVLITEKPILQNKFSVMKIGLFGSFSIDDATNESDIDILVEFDKPIGWEFFDLQDYLQNLFNRKIDLVSTKALKPQLRDKIINQTIFI